MLIGREVTESEVCNWIRQGRFVTLLRPGGIGETTVAVAHGHDADVRLIAALVHSLKIRRLPHWARQIDPTGNHFGLVEIVSSPK